MTDCAAEWGGAWGSDYTNRNRVEWLKRVPFWQEMLERTHARTVYEVGCNAGWNLSAIRRVAPDTQLFGCEINRRAAFLAKLAGFSVDNGDASQALGGYTSTYDLVFTAGVLIHVPPDKLRDLMMKMAAASYNHVLAVEYAADKEEEVNYRGREGMLWRRPYGKLYEELGLKTVAHGHAGDGFDNCHYWLMRKP